jgi:hypothetical protein
MYECSASILKPYASIEVEMDAAIAEVLESQRFILGPTVDQCENDKRGLILWDAKYNLF